MKRFGDASVTSRSIVWGPARPNRNRVRTGSKRDRISVNNVACPAACGITITAVTCCTAANDKQFGGAAAPPYNGSEFMNCAKVRKPLCRKAFERYDEIVIILPL